MKINIETLVGRCYHDTDRRRHGFIAEIKHGALVMQLANGVRFLIHPEALKRSWIELDITKQRNNQNANIREM